MVVVIQAVQEHVLKNRLLELAEKDSRLSEFEFDHIEKCSECLAAYARSILQVARTRAKEKTGKGSNGEAARS